MKRLRQWLRDSRGSEIAEAALVLPLAFMLMLAIFWFGRAFNIYATINRAAREAALFAASPNCATCPPCSNCGNQAYIQTNVVNPILASAHLDPSAVQNFTVNSGVSLNPGSPVLETGVIVSLRYHYPFRLYGVTCCPMALTTLFNGITMSAQARARQEN